MDEGDRSALAAEYSLGLLTGVERLLAERRLATDPKFRADVESWQEDLSGLLAPAEADPPPTLRTRIVEEIRVREARPLPGRILGGFLSRDDRLLVAATLGVKAVILLAIGIAVWLL